MRFGKAGWDRVLGSLSFARCHRGLGANGAENCKAELLMKKCEECLRLVAAETAVLHAIIVSKEVAHVQGQPRAETQI